MHKVINVAVAGAQGKMGQASVETVLNQPDMSLVAELTRQSTADDWQTALTQADVGVDMTHPDSVYENALRMINGGVRPVVGTTGLTDIQLTDLDAHLKTKGLCGMVIPNFAIGAVLMMQFAKQAARYFDHAEIIELHHNRKADAPSGTALKTAQLMAETRQGDDPTQQFGSDNVPEKETLAGARGAHGPANIHIHSVRLPGLVAHQEVLLAAPGQLLTLRHDSFDRQCFMPGVVLCIQQIMQRPAGLIYGLEHLL